MDAVEKIRLHYFSENSEVFGPQIRVPENLCIPDTSRLAVLVYRQLVSPASREHV